MDRHDTASAFGEQLAEIASTLKDTRRQLRRARNTQQRSGHSQPSEWVLDARASNTALIIFTRAGFETAPAADFLSDLGGRKNWSPQTPQELDDLLCQIFLAETDSDASGLLALVDDANPADPVALRQATRFLEEWRLYQWTHRLNVDKGVSPSTRSLLHRVASTRLASGHPSPHGLGTVANSRSRMWATRFRRRWGGRYGHIRECDHLPRDELLTKASRVAQHTCR